MKEYRSIRSHHCIHRPAIWVQVKGPGGNPAWEVTTPAPIEFLDGRYKPKNAEEEAFLDGYHGLGRDYVVAPTTHEIEDAMKDAEDQTQMIKGVSNKAEAIEALKGAGVVLDKGVKVSAVVRAAADAGYVFENWPRSKK